MTTGDLRQGIVTLPFFYYLQSQPDPERVIAKLEKDEAGKGNGMAEIISAVRASDAISLARAEARTFADRAKADLNCLPAGPFQLALRELADFAVERRV